MTNIKYGIQVPHRFWKGGLFKIKTDESATHHDKGSIILGYKTEAWDGKKWRIDSPNSWTKMVTLDELRHLLLEHWDEMNSDDMKYWNSIDVWEEEMLQETGENA